MVRITGRTNDFFEQRQIFEVSGLEDWDIRDLVLVVDDDGDINECDEDNNEDRWGQIPCLAD